MIAGAEHVAHAPPFDVESRRLPNSAGEALRSPLLWLVLGILAEFYAFWIAARLMLGDILGFVHIGRRFLESSESSPAISSIGRSSSEVGYDGQFYYFFAVDPLRAHEYMGEFAGYVYSRPLYPALSWLLGLGRAEAIAYAMLAINLVAVAAATLALAAWLRRHGLSPWLSLVYGTSPAVAFSVFHNLTEPLAYTLALFGVLLFDPTRRTRLVASAGVFALAVLTRETTAVFPAVCALGLLLGWPELKRSNLAKLRRWALSAAFVAAAVAPLLIWRALLLLWLDTPTQERPGDPSTLLIPFYALASRWPWSASSLIIAGAVVLPTIVTIVAARHLFRGPSAGAIAAALLAVNALCFVVFVPEPIDVDYGAAGRSAMGVLIAAILCLPFLRGRPHSGRLIASVAFVWSYVWFAIVSALAGELPFSVFV